MVFTLKPNLCAMASERSPKTICAQTWISRWKVPSEYIVYADRDGNIGEHSTGLAPLRKGFDGLLQLPADGGYEWSGVRQSQDDSRWISLCGRLSMGAAEPLPTHPRSDRTGQAIRTQTNSCGYAVAVDGCGVAGRWYGS